MPRAAPSLLAVLLALPLAGALQAGAPLPDGSVSGVAGGTAEGGGGVEGAERFAEPPPPRAVADPITGLFRSVDWPPPGARLRDLARRLHPEIGFAARREWQTLDEAELYAAIARAEFGIVTPESSLKWLYVHPFEKEYDFDDMDRLVEFAEANGMRLHGHPLTWYLLNPTWLETLPATDVAAALEAHVGTVVSRYAGRVQIWDVVNEGLADDGPGLRAEDPFAAALGPAYMDIAFRAARAADPAATLIYNDYDIGWLTEKSARALALVDALRSRDVPIDGIGMQMHLDHTFDKFEEVSTVMQRFADRDLDVFVTEFDVGVLSPEDYGVQADVYEEVIRRCLMQPRCEALQIWGLDDFYSWRPYFDPLPFDDDFRVKPAYFGMQRALMTQPVHPESCALDGARVASGTVYAGTGAGDAFRVRCADVPLAGGFTSLAVRYRNPGTDTPELAIAADGVPLVTVALAPVADPNVEDFRTVSVAVPPLDGTATLTLAVGPASDGAEVGVDALLFGTPTRPLPLPDVADGGASGGGSAPGAGGSDGGGTAFPGTAPPGAGGGTNGGGGTDSGTGGSSGGGGGAVGALWLGVLGAASGLGVARRRRRA